MLAATLLPACGGTDDPAPGGAAGAGPGSCSTTAEGGGDATKGATLYSTQCATCHNADASGKEAPNITLSTTAGIGSWTYAQFYNAVRNAKDKDGTDLCVFMSKFEPKDVSDCGAQDIYAFIKSKPVNNTVNKGTYCP